MKKENSPLEKICTDVWLEHILPHLPLKDIPDIFLINKSHVENLDTDVMWFVRAKQDFNAQCLVILKDVMKRENTSKNVYKTLYLQHIIAICLDKRNKKSILKKLHNYTHKELCAILELRLREIEVCLHIKEYYIKYSLHKYPKISYEGNESHRDLKMDITTKFSFYEYFGVDYADNFSQEDFINIIIPGQLPHICPSIVLKGIFQINGTKCGNSTVTISAMSNRFCLDCTCIFARNYREFRKGDTIQFYYNTAFIDGCIEDCDDVFVDINGKQVM